MSEDNFIIHFPLLFQNPGITNKFTQITYISIRLSLLYLQLIFCCSNSCPDYRGNCIDSYFPSHIPLLVGLFMVSLNMNFLLQCFKTILITFIQQFEYFGSLKYSHDYMIFKCTMAAACGVIIAQNNFISNG